MNLGGVSKRVSWPGSNCVGPIRSVQVAHNCHTRQSRLLPVLRLRPSFEPCPVLGGEDHRERVVQVLRRPALRPEGLRWCGSGGAHAAFT